MRKLLLIGIVAISFFFIILSGPALAEILDHNNMTKDIHVQQDFPDSNFSGISVGETATPVRTQNTYNQWDLSPIPDAVYITNAEICLYASSIGHTEWYDKLNIGVYEVYSDDWTTMTWNNQTCGTNWDNTTNCNIVFDNSSGLRLIGNPPNQWFQSWTCWNITRIVQNEYSGDKIISLGFHVINYSGYGGVVGFRGHTDTKSAYLIINYTAMPTPPYTCPNQKDCSIYTEETLLDFFQGALCGLYNFIVCMASPHILTMFYAVLALLIVSLFALMAYIASAGG